MSEREQSIKEWNVCGSNAHEIIILSRNVEISRKFLFA